MGSLRLLLRRNALAAWAVIAAALLMKAIVPAGFMPVMTASGMAMLWCPGMTEVAPASMTMAMAPQASVMPGMTHHATATHHRQGEQAPAKSEGPCAFAGLTAPGLAGVDIVLLAIAFAAIVAAALLFKPIAPVARCAFLRPPLRGPPARA